MNSCQQYSISTTGWTLVQWVEQPLDCVGTQKMWIAKLKEADITDFFGLNQSLTRVVSFEYLPGVCASEVTNTWVYPVMNL